MKTLILLLLIPVITTAQNGYLATEVDFKNTILQSGVKETKGYNGTIKIGYSAYHFQIEGFVELYPNIDYTSFGVNGYYNFIPENKLRPLIGLQISMINRSNAYKIDGELIYGKLNASLGANAMLEYHFSKWGFISARWEMKYRSDLKTFEEQKERERPIANYIIGSGFVGIGVKI